MQHFDRQIKICATKSGSEILFAHKKSVDRPEGYRLHLNDYVEIYIYVSGDADYIVEDTCYALKKGDVLVITPHEVHVPVLKTECEYERFYILVPPDTFGQFRYNPLLPHLIKPREKGALIALSEPERKQFLDILYQISSFGEEPTEQAQLQAYAMITRLLCMLLPAEREEETHSLREAAVPKVLKEVLVYISSHAGQISSVGELAEQFHISLPYLSTLFKKHVGVTGGAYLRTKKVALAKKLLEEGSSVTEACFESGFCDCSYFIKVFKQCIGITPHRYRSMYIKKHEKQAR